MVALIIDLMVDLVVNLKVVLIAGAAVNLTDSEKPIPLSISNLKFKMRYKIKYGRHSDLNSNTRLYVAHICTVWVNWMKTVGDALKMSIYSYIQDHI